MQNRMPALYDARWLRVFFYGFFLLMDQNQAEYKLKDALRVINRAIAESPQLSSGESLTTPECLNAGIDCKCIASFSDSKTRVSKV